MDINMQNTFQFAVGVCCCLQIRNSVLYMVVKGLVLRQSLPCYYAKVSPLNYVL